MSINFDNLKNLKIDIEKNKKLKLQVLKQSEGLISFLTSLQKQAIKALQEGESIEGVSLTRGKGVSQWNEKAELFLTEELGEEAFQIIKKLKPISTIKEKLGSVACEPYIEKSSGKLKLAFEKE